ncbi:carboxypeptidase-like regulatory domain-containing protein [Formosa maritima]|uniref:TonB-dependent receptor plug domain-containing protein n=1 Tax=Formosa maritima TaxID=2592046 RepID=A0A5D0GEE2_9FLAO|nr:carboxypeptidase-like regulatory domain-containing protein [Formosa maritima]TYA57304.1 TonB-dependent receptor plug domain-containing protein [Formosa maritima]
MRSKTRLVLFLCIILSHTWQVMAQEKVLLPEILKMVEIKFDVQFNYASENINHLLVPSPIPNLNLEEVIEFLEKETNLKFIESENRIIIISKKPDTHICGYILNKEDGLPIEQATIQNKNFGTVSNKNGYFEIEIRNHEDLLIIRSLGFNTMNLKASEFQKTKCNIIFLEQNVHSLSEVYLTNYITNGISKTNLGSYEIDITKFDILPGLIDADVLQSVQAFPGILSIDETVSNINIRGGSNDQNLILWDGIKMYQSGHFFGLISIYNPQIVKNVLVIKNGTSASFTDGVSGTISINSNKELNTKTKGSIGFNLIDLNGYLDLKISNKSSIEIAARKSLYDFIKTPTFNRYFERITQDPEFENNTTNIVNKNEDFDFYDFSLRWLYEISSKDKLSVSFINAYNKLVFDENTIVDNRERSKESKLTQNSIAGSLLYNRFWNEKLNTTFEFYESDYKLQATNANIIEDQRFQQENQISESSLKVFGNYKFNKSLKLNLGYQFVETEITNLDDVDNPIYRLLVSEVLRTNGLFSELAYNSSNNQTQINFGIRYNYINKFNKNLLEPRLSFTHKFWNNFSIEVLAEFKSQNTSQIINLQNDFLGVEKRRWQLSNNNSIPIIKSKQASFGINYSKNNFLISSEFYYKHISDITTQSQGFVDQHQYVKSIGDNNVFGLDFLLRKSFTNYNFWISYSFMDNKYSFNSISTNPFPSNFDVTHAVTWGSSYTKNKFKFSLGLNWHSGKPYTKPVEGNEIVDNKVNYQPTNSSRLDSYFRVDVSAIYDINISKKVKGEFGASLWNILGTKNIINTYYTINNGSVIQTNEFSLGFTPNVSARFIFK